MLSFRRRIGIASTGNRERGEVRASLEDDFHHFRVRLVHAQRRIQAIEGFAVRHPYTTCPLAAGQLSRLCNAELSSLAHSVMRMTDASQQCTHLMDLSGLAIAAAARSIRERWFDIEVPRRIEGCCVARLDRDGMPLLSWELRDTAIVAPSPFCGISLREG